MKASEDGAHIVSIVARGQNTITLTLDSLSLRTEKQFGFFTDAENATLIIKGKTSISANTFALP